MAAAEYATREDFQRQIEELQSRTTSLRSQALEDGGEKEKENGERIGFAETGHFDNEIYDGMANRKYDGYVYSIPANEADEDEDDYSSNTLMQKNSYTAPTSLFAEQQKSGKDYDPMAEHRIPRILDREDEYRRLRLGRKLSPERNDPFADAHLISVIR